jgi:erythronate-4-phosphate dehydrogenase
MKIVADANIPYAQEAFENLGEVELLSGRLIGPAHVRDADLLLVRSVTPVNGELLAGSRIRFVGSATIGVDHVDLAFLQKRNIAFAYAPGSNANSVAEYVIAALLEVSRKSLRGRTLGIIGLGRIGSLVQIKAEALGMLVLANDPPLTRAGRVGLVPLEKLLEASDIVTCHVPLTADGPDATYHLLDQAKLSRLQPHAVVINTARGPVVDNTGLLGALQKARIRGAVLDVWEGEPSPNPDLIRAVILGTPHIAGYSYNGKVNGTVMLYDAACTFLGHTPRWSPPPIGSSYVTVDSHHPLQETLSELVRGVYDIRRDDAEMRAMTTLPEPKRPAAFDKLRETYPRRLEFSNTTMRIADSPAELRAVLVGLGFRTVSSPPDK